MLPSVRGEVLFVVVVMMEVLLPSGLVGGA